MRVALMSVFVLGLASAATAQSHASHANDHLSSPSIGLPLPHIGLPLPTIGLPLPQMGLPSGRSGQLERPQQLARPERLQRPDRFRRPGRPGAAVFAPTYGWPYLSAAAFPVWPSYPTPPWPGAQIENATGRLLLTMRSGVDPQIFVDGYFVGQFSDVAGQLTLDVGSHTIDVHEEGYENLRFAVNVSLDDVIAYDVALRPIEDRRPIEIAPPSVQSIPSPSAPPPTTIYVIPGCYIGNVPPKDAGLPSGCDARGVVAFPSRP
jgi:hypothetical protein